MQIVTIDPWLKHNSRPTGTRISTIVLHHTAGASAESTIQYQRSPLVRSSYHYIIERDGTIYKCVPVSERAWHAGISKGPEGSDVNNYSIGISLANRGNGEAYPFEQVLACQELIDELWSKIPSLRFITTHRLIAPGRKIDPKAFAFHNFAKTRTRLQPWRNPNRSDEWDG